MSILIAVEQSGEIQIDFHKALEDILLDWILTMNGIQQ